jgi:methionine-S-sulfoxide reductase
MGESAETAVLAGGCFWGVQELMRKQRGVIATRAGWTGGDIPNPTEASPGTHAEAVEIVFDPEQTSFRDILEFFFQIHDPTTINRQMDDIGTDYRSAIFYTPTARHAISLGRAGSCRTANPRPDPGRTGLPPHCGDGVGRQADTSLQPAVPAQEAVRLLPDPRHRGPEHTASSGMPSPSMQPIADPPSPVRSVPSCRAPSVLGSASLL